jgi:putative ABC transport system permease protein
MLELTLRNMRVNKRRMVGAVVAVCLGVAFLTGTLVLSDTLRTNFSTLFSQANASTDVVIRGATKFGTDTRQQTRIGVPTERLNTVRAQPGVADAQPYLEGYGRLLGRNGKAVGGNGPPTRAANWITDNALNPYRVVAGRAPSAPGEVVINRGAAKTGHLHVGDTTMVETPQPVTVRIVGVATFGSADGLGPTTFTAFTTTDAQRYVASAPDQITEIRVKAAPGTSAVGLASQLTGVLPSSMQAMTGSQQAGENYNQINKGFLGFVRSALLTFAAIALIVGAFSIHNTLSILAAQRSRESALLRAIGARRRQVLGAAIVESATIGVLGSLAGIAAGMGIAGLLKGVFAGFGLALPAGGLDIRASSLIVALLVGLVVTLTAGASPARRASRVAPLAAVRDIDAGADTASRTRRWVGAVVAVGGIVAAVGAATVGHGSGKMAPAALGAVLLIAGVVLLGPIVARPAASALGAPVAALRGITGTLARENATRQPRRTAGTAAALLVGVSVVALFTVLAGSVKASLADGVKRSVAGDLVVGGSTFGGGGLSPQLASEISRLPQVDAAAGIGSGAALIDGHTSTVSIADPAQLGSLVDLGVVAGSGANLGSDGLAVSRTTARSHHWQVGRSLPVVYPDGKSGQLHVVAIYTNRTLVNNLLITPAAFAPHDAQAIDAQIIVKVRPGSSPLAARAAVEGAAAPYGRPAVQTRSEYQNTASKGVNTALGLIYVMLALAIVIALLGIANTLSLAVHERTRELGLLRAVGQTRAQTRSMVHWEAVIVAVFGTLGGLACGVLLGWALVRTASGDTMSTFAAPIGQLLAILIIGGLAGVLAAIRPARRAARLDVLQALAVS